jgi:spermidine synthase
MAGCFIFSGATGLVYEMLWARMLGLVFGATTLAVSTVLAAFMGGLALGSVLGGRYGGRIPRPLLAYGLLEICIAIFAIAVPVLFNLVDNLYALIWRQFQPGFLIFGLWRFLLSGTMLLAPTTLMGATLPILSATLLRAGDFKQTSTARLYGFNLVGAILGTIGAGFWLLPTFGIRTTIYVAAAVNILIGVLVILAEYRSSVSSFELSGECREPEQSLDSYGAGFDRKFWTFLAFISGFVTISTQVAWTRILTMVIGSSTYAFSIVVALFLLGLWSGAYVISCCYSSRDLRATVFKIEVAIAASLYLSLVIANQLPHWLVTTGLRINLASWLGLTLLQVAAAALLVLLPAFLMGTVVPLALVWANRNQSLRIVKLVGRTLAVNTMGAIAGAFSVGFLLIPTTGTRNTIIFAAALSLIVAGAAYQPAAGIRNRDLSRSLVIGAIPLLIIILLMVTPRINLAELSVGAYDGLIRELAQSRETGAASPLNIGPEIHKLLMYDEGITATVSVRKDWNTISLAINGRTNASDLGDMPTQVMLGQLPLLLAPRMRNGLVVGFASGVTVGSVLQSPIESLDCVELEPATIKASRYFEHVNNQPLRDPRLRLIIDDARTLLRVISSRYDLIVSEPSHPWVMGVANLFTKEFFELGKERLADEGVFVQWLQIYQLSTDSLKSVLATFTKVFPRVLVFRIGGTSKGKDLILVGSKQQLSLKSIQERMQDPRMSTELARVEMKTAADVMSWYVCDEQRIGPEVRGAVINSDDNMYIETTVPREAFLPLMKSNAEWIEKLR